MRSLGPLLASLLLALSACGGSDDGGSDGASDGGGDTAGTSQQQDPTAAPEPDLDGIPEVVAEVNGTEIPRDEFVDAYTPQYQQLVMQSQGSGGKVDEKGLQQQVVNNLVNAELLVQEADDRGFDASARQTDDALQELAEQNGMKTADEFVAALEEQGMEAATIESQVADQVRIDQLLADEAGGAEPTEKQLRDLYRQLKEQASSGGQGQQVPPLAKVRPQLEDQLKSQQESQVAGDLLQDLRKDADIQIHI